MSVNIKKKYILVGPYKTFNWLLAPIINKFKIKYNFNIIFIIPEGYALPEIYEQNMTKQDKIFFYKSFKS